MPEPRQVIRTCIGCRQRHERGTLIRLAAVGEPPVLAIDALRRLPGRGAWLHPREECLARAVSRRAFPRALRRPDLVVSDDLAQAFSHMMKAG